MTREDQAYGPRRHPDARNVKGREFGKLRVVEVVARRPTSVVWRCVCACGGEIELTTQQVVSRAAKTCGKCRRSGGMGSREIRDAYARTRPAEDRGVRVGQVWLRRGVNREETFVVRAIIGPPGFRQIVGRTPGGRHITARVAAMATNPHGAYELLSEPAQQQGQLGAIQPET